MSSRPAAPAGAWGKKPSDAVRAAPTAAVVTPPPKHQNGKGANRNRGRGGGRGGRAGGEGRDGGRGGGGHQHHQSGGGHHQKPPNTNLANVKLCQSGDGTTTAQKQVHRIPADVFLRMRMQFLDAPPDWIPPTEVHWTDDDREETIVAMHHARRKGGDVTAFKHKRPPVKETAPPLEECKPLEVNEETRWKAKVFEGATDEQEQDSDEVVLKKALSILNKLSLTTFDKLSQELVDLGIARNEACLKGVIELIVENAHVQPHFANMYALLCSQLSAWQLGGKKTFKKMLLTQCQVEFEKDTSKQVQEMIAGIEDKEEREYQAALVKKNYLGHMRFIGELYKNDMIKIDIMLWCLKTLLEDDEEQLECFVKLMTTSGGSLEQQALALEAVGKPASREQLQECWKKVGQFTTKGPNNRIKFMLQGLLELRDNGWAERRKTETAQTIDQIHKELAKEERARGKVGSIPKPAMNLGSRRASTGDVRVLERKPPIVDQDGFVQVVRTNSATSLQQAAMAAVRKPNPTLRRAVSLPATQLIEENAPPPPKKEFPAVEDCAGKTQNILKEYFIGGDVDDAVLSIDEIVGFGHDGSIERGAKVIEGGTLLVMEMKETEVKQFLTVLLRCLKENKIQRKSVAMGLADPLEYLGDIEIDAPLARSHLATIVAELVGEKAVRLDFLLEAPDYFRSDGRAAHYCAKVLKAMDCEITDADVDIIEKLMTEDDKAVHATARDLLASV